MNVYCIDNLNGWRLGVLWVCQDQGQRSHGVRFVGDPLRHQCKRSGITLSLL